MYKHEMLCIPSGVISSGAGGAAAPLTFGGILFFLKRLKAKYGLFYNKKSTIVNATATPTTVATTAEFLE